MTIRLMTALALVLASGPAFAAPEPPDLSQSAIDSADLAGWEARKAEAAKSQEQAKTEAETKPAAGTGGAEVEATDVPESANPEATEAEAKATEPEAEKTEVEKAEELPDPFLIRLQVLLDRAHASPGVIDGLSGGNTEKAVRAFEEMKGLTVDGTVDEDLWKALSADTAPAVKVYELTKEDVDGRYVAEIPSDYGEMAKLDWLGYRGATEALGERFHMDEDLLRILNPNADFKAVGAKILVPDTGTEPETKVARIVVDKSKGELIAYDEADKIVLVDPATIGSADTPSPSGTMKVNGSAPEPTYEYDPKKNFQQGDNSKKLTIPAGPNGPVGSMWIDLSKPTYGIHGTPEPSKIDKTASHGCVRLTNWDAQALSKLVQPGKTVVEFKG
jgi:lipoprotein-anchoring transpeptidase ErfK/SrfK